MFKYLHNRRFRLSSIGQQTITRMSIGANKYPLLVIDDFYADPVSVASFAHNLDFLDPTGKHINAMASCPADTKPIDRFIFDYFAREMGVMKSSQMRGSVNRHKFYRSIPSGSDLPIRREHPHSDGVFFIAGVLYLTPDKYCKGGTGFYRHRATGAEEKPPSPIWLNEKKVPDSVIKALGERSVYRAYRESHFDGFDEYLRQIPTNTKENKFHLSASNDEWELTQIVPMKFNRLILYPAFVIHKAIYNEDDFDGAEEQRRLTQNFFYKYPIDNEFN